MNIGELFVTMGVKIDDAMNAATSKFITKLSDVQKEAQELNKIDLGAKPPMGKKFLTALQNVKEKLLQLKEFVLEKSGFAEISKDFSKAAKESQGFTGFLTRLVTGANLARLAILGMGASLAKLVMNAAEASEHLFKFSINTGMDTTSLQKWQQQAGMAGVQAEEVANSFKNMQRLAIEAQLGQASESTMGAYRQSGVSWLSDPESMMGQIQKMLKNRPAALGTKLASDMGLSEEMVSFLRMKDTLQPADENLILSKDEIAELKDFNIKFTSSINQMKMALIKLGAIIAPVMKPIFALFTRVMLATTQFTAWLSGMGKWKGMILGIASAIAIAVTAFFFPVTATVLLIGGIIAGVLLLIDDVATFLRGGDSVTGDVVKGWKKGFSSFFGWFGENAKYIGAYLVTELLNGVETIWTYWQNFTDWIYNNWTYLIKYLGDELGGIFGFFKDLLGFGSSVEFNKEEKPSYANTIPMRPMFSNPKAAGNSYDSSSSTAVNQNVTIQVNGAQNPTNIAMEISNKLKNQINHAAFQLPRGE